MRTIDRRCPRCKKLRKFSPPHSRPKWRGWKLIDGEMTCGVSTHQEARGQTRRGGSTLIRFGEGRVSVIDKDGATREIGTMREVTYAGLDLASGPDRCFVDGVEVSLFHARARMIPKKRDLHKQHREGKRIARMCIKKAQENRRAYVACLTRSGAISMQHAKKAARIHIPRNAR